MRFAIPVAMLVAGGLFAAACGAHAPVVVDPEIARVVKATGPEEPTDDDELRAYSLAEYLGMEAGRGVSGGGLDLSASCGCADISSASGPSGSGPGVTPEIEFPNKSKLKVHVVLKPR